MKVTTQKKLTMTGIRYTGNVIEKCVYGIEYFGDQIDGERESYMDDVIMSDNFIRLSGYGWRQQCSHICCGGVILHCRKIRRDLTQCTG